MLIRTQEDELIVLENVLKISIGLYPKKGWAVEVLYCSQNPWNENEGTQMCYYSSHEKALKVLDMIEESYAKNCNVFHIPADSEVKV